MLTEHADCRACGAPAARKPATTHAKTSDDTCENPMYRLTLLLIAVARRTRSHFHTPRSPYSLHTLCPLSLPDARQSPALLSGVERDYVIKRQRHTHEQEDAPSIHDLFGMPKARMKTGQCIHHRHDHQPCPSVPSKHKKLRSWAIAAPGGCQSVPCVHAEALSLEARIMLSCSSILA